MTNIWHCPHCGASDYALADCEVTGLHSPPFVVGDTVFRYDLNERTETRVCVCGETTIVKLRYGKIIDDH